MLRLSIIRQSGACALPLKQLPKAIPPTSFALAPHRFFTSAPTHVWSQRPLIAIKSTSSFAWSPPSLSAKRLSHAFAPSRALRADTPSSAAPQTASAASSNSSPASGATATTSTTTGGGGEEITRVQPKSARGPGFWIVVLVGAAFSVLIYQYDSIKQKKLNNVRTREATSVGTPKLGGPFELRDSSGNTVTDRDFFGKYILVYFGFTNCPDICPTELKKMDVALKKFAAYSDVNSSNIVIQPIFITVDPKRDTPARLEAYKKELNMPIVMLTGNDEQLGRVAKSYRMYYSKPPTDTDDYQVDHSIFFFLSGPDGKFLEYYGKNLTADEVASRMRQTVMADKAQRSQASMADAMAKQSK